MSFDNLLVQREARVAVLTIQRPQRLNALDAATLDDSGTPSSIFNTTNPSAASS